MGSRSKKAKKTLKEEIQERIKKRKKELIEKNRKKLKKRNLEGFGRATYSNKLY